MSVFVNRTLNLKKITHIGFDMDLTLVKYNVAQSEALVYKMALDNLIKEHGYPKELKLQKFNPNFCIRGLILDKKNGNLLKLNRFGAIRTAYNGKLKLYLDQIAKTYPHRMIDLKSSDFHYVNADFDLGMICLIKDIIDYKKDAKDPYDLPSHEKICTQVIDSVDTVHSNDSLKKRILDNVDLYIQKSEAVVKGLKKLIQHEKKLLLITNSEFYYMKAIMDYAINPFLEEGESWESLFEVIVSQACKPKFFYDQDDFYKVDESTKKIDETPSKEIIAQQTYAKGSSQKLMENLGLKDETSILYIGDHLFGDILKLKKHCAWRTGLVLEALDEEIASLKKSGPIQKSVDKIMGAKLPLEKELDELISKKIEQPDKFSQSNVKRIEVILSEISKINASLSELIPQHEKAFNSFWGPLFKVGAEDSFLSYQVEAYAEIYMSNLSDFLSQSPRTYYRPTLFKQMPHELV